MSSDFKRVHRPFFKKDRDFYTYFHAGCDFDEQIVGCLLDRVIPVLYGFVTKDCTHCTAEQNGGGGAVTLCKADLYSLLSAYWDRLLKTVDIGLFKTDLKAHHFLSIEEYDGNDNLFSNVSFENMFPKKYMKNVDWILSRLASSDLKTHWMEKISIWWNTNKLQDIRLICLDDVDKLWLFTGHQGIVPMICHHCNSESYRHDFCVVCLE